MRVVMLVQNDWKHDSRVVREAECLAHGGHVVDVICRRVIDKSVIEQQNGVTYHCIPHEPRKRVVRLPALLRLHFRVMLLETDGMGRIPETQGSLATWATVIALAGIGGLFVLLLSPLLASFMIARVVVRQVRRWLLVTRAWTKERFGPSSRAHVTFEAFYAFVLSTGRLVRRPARPVFSCVSYVTQPFSYLNDSAWACMVLILRLRPEVIHAHDLVTLSGAALAARSIGCRFVYDAHELERHTNYWSLNRWTRYWIARYETVLARRATAVITVCDSIADWLAAEYGIRRPLVVLNAPTGAPPASSGVEVGQCIRGKLGLADSTPLVAYVGSVTIDRGLDLCVRALAYLSDVHFAAVGARYNVTEAEMIRAAIESGVLNRLHFVDPVPSNQVMAFMRGADCSVMAIQNVCLSYYFCFPNKLLESVFAGLPVAVANLPEMRAFVEKHGLGVIMDETNPRSIAEAIGTLLENRERYRPSSAKIKEIEDQYGWRRQSEKLLDLYANFSQTERSPRHEARVASGSG
jgi:glycosyltransferase involved in cell wall biosynthesis